MRKFYIYTLTLITFIPLFTLQANAVECKPAWNWNWTTVESCTWPDWYKVYWDISVLNHTITLWVDVDMWIDLSVNKITFSNDSLSKILLDTTSKIANHVTNRYYEIVAFIKWWSPWLIPLGWCTWEDDSDCYWETTPTTTECETWMHVFYHQVAPTDPATHYIIANDIPSYVGETWNMYCWIRSN